MSDTTALPRSHRAATEDTPLVRVLLIAIAVGALAILVLAPLITACTGSTVVPSGARAAQITLLA